MQPDTQDGQLSCNKLHPNFPVLSEVWETDMGVGCSVSSSLLLQGLSSGFTAQKRCRQRVDVDSSLGLLVRSASVHFAFYLRNLVLYLRVPTLALVLPVRKQLAEACLWALTCSAEGLGTCFSLCLLLDCILLPDVPM